VSKEWRTVRHIASFPRMVDDRVQIFVTLATCNSRMFVSIREHYQDTRTGEWFPTKRGITLGYGAAVKLLEALIKAGRVWDGEFGGELYDVTTTTLALLQRFQETMEKSRLSESETSLESADTL